ncbi:sensor histidine kinase [Paenibacillus rigui]|uniref:histidine kinase n=1 Tax=Paenibacillus rigui TaxID=554312 RepID=A0A229UK00_9BACL|nr:HAMP domain-containing sensor histidine kinase [Paenibacillus rigui]OXM83726.1 two-component sensor histidine kinase [Paenibacillus rigui]
MSIRIRLLLSYSSMLVASIVLFLLAGFLVAVAMTGDVKSVRSFYTSHYAVKPLSEPEESTYLDIKYYVKNGPAQLYDPALLQELDQKLAPIQAGIIGRQGSQLSYLSPRLNSAELPASLPPIETSNIKVRDTVQAGSRYFTYVKYDFTVPADKSEGSIYILKEVSPYGEMTRELLPVWIGVLLLSLMATNLLLYIWASRAIVKPLQSLRQSAELIKAGELDSAALPLLRSDAAMGETRPDEIGQLAQSFEEMRRKLKQSVELQLQYEENRKELVSNISHDLKTPMTSIIGYVEGIQDGVAATPDKMDTYLKTIHSKAKQMDRLIDELFLFSKLDLNKVPFVFEPLDIGVFLQQTAEELRFDLEQKGIRLDKPEAGKPPVLVFADRDQLKRLIGNMVDNSLKHMDKREPRIAIGWGMKGPNGDEVVVCMEDNGAGIAAEALPYVFDRFYRADASRSGQSGGSGLGLAIAKQIIERHGGRIWAESEPGKGTRMFFTLRKNDEANGRPGEGLA